MKHPDSESSDDYAWLFDQLTDIGDGITSNLQFEQLAEFDVESSRLLSQRDALNHLETAQFSDDIADILDFLRNNPTIDVNAMFNDILENIALLHSSTIGATIVALTSIVIILVESRCAVRVSWRKYDCAGNWSTVRGSV